MFTQDTVANCGKDCPVKSDLLLPFQRVRACAQLT
jgi:hypothetical protein